MAGNEPTPAVTDEKKSEGKMDHVKNDASHVAQDVKSGCSRVGQGIKHGFQKVGGFFSTGYHKVKDPISNCVHTHKKEENKESAPAPKR